MEVKQIKMFCMKKNDCIVCPLKTGHMNECLLEPQPIDWNLELIEYVIDKAEKAEK